MHVFDPSDVFDVNDSTRYTIRSNVRAIDCPEGASLTDKDGNVIASYAGPCFVVEGDDADHHIVSAYVFDGLYEAVDNDNDADDPAVIDPTPAATGSTSTLAPDTTTVPTATADPTAATGQADAGQGTTQGDPTAPASL